MTQITVEMPDPLGPYLVIHGGPFHGPVAIARGIVIALSGGAAGWVSAQAWAGAMPPMLGTLVFVYLTWRMFPMLSQKISADISGARMYHAAACAALAIAAYEEMVRPREELGAQTL